VLVLCLVPLASQPLLGAWTEKSYERVAEKSSMLMPTSLRAVLSTHKERLLEGAVAPTRLAGEAGHVEDPGGKRFLKEAILRQVQKIRRLLRDRAPFSEITFEMGVLSHYLADANHPLQTSSTDPREPEYRADYAVYLEKQMHEKYPLVFQGYGDAHLKRGDVEAFVESSIQRSRRKYPRIGQDYIRRGRLVSSKVFDEFSFAFGVGALSYSHAVGDTVKLWLFLWKEAGGDIEGLPTLEPMKRK
jgi:hypothetical protein